jgi:protein-S-isoprenylcysteine O-methyltransferase Ste14
MTLRQLQELELANDMVQKAPQDQHPMPLAANLGAARPPTIYMIAIVVGLGLHFAWPIRFVPNSARLFGGFAIVFAATLFIWSTRTFRSAGTPVPGNQPTSTIVKVGPYRVSRNPIYFSFSLFQAGVALGVNDAWILITLLPAIAVISFVVIPREERYLESNFGDEYAMYKASVRRWL